MLIVEPIMYYYHYYCYFVTKQYVFCLLLVFLVEAAVALFCLYFRFYFPMEVRSNLKTKLDNHYGMEMQEVFSEALDFTQYEVRPFLFLVLSFLLL